MGTTKTRRVYNNRTHLFSFFGHLPLFLSVRGVGGGEH